MRTTEAVSILIGKMQKMIEKNVKIFERIIVFHKTLIFFTIFLVAIVTRLYFVDFDLYSKPPVDDAYITYRYAENIVDSRGFVYNENQHVLGTTTSLYTLVLAFFITLGLDIFFISNVIGLICGLLSCALIYFIGKNLNHPYAGLLAALFVGIDGNFVAWSGSGMETTLYTSILLASIYYYSTEKYNLVAFFLALLCLTRPDGVILTAVLSIHYIYTKREMPYNAIVIFTLLILPWILYAFYTFGSPIPNSLPAKQTHLKTLITWAPIIYFPYQFRILFPFALLGIGKVIIKCREFTPILVYFVVYLGIYSLLGIPLLGTWYWAPHIPIFFLVCCVGIMDIYRYIQSQTLPEFHVELRKVLFVILVLFILANSGNSLIDEHERHTTRQEQFEIGYMSTGLWLKENTPENSTVFIGDIGVIGYYSERRILDRAGLISPEIVEIRQEHDDKSYAEVNIIIMKKYLPDYMIVQTWYEDMYNYFVQSEWFNDNYREVKRFPWEGSEHDIVIFERI